MQCDCPICGAKDANALIQFFAKCGNCKETVTNGVVYSYDGLLEWMNKHDFTSGDASQTPPKLILPDGVKVKLPEDDS